MLKIWSSTGIDLGSFAARPAAAGSINPLFALNAVTGTFNAASDNQITLSLIGQGFTGTLDDASTQVAVYTANGVLGAAAGVTLFSNLSAVNPNAVGGVYYLSETAAGSNDYNLTFQGFNYSVAGLTAAGSAVSLVGAPKTLASHLGNVTGFNYNNTATGFIYEAVVASSADPSVGAVKLQTFDTTGTATGPLTQVAAAVAATTVTDLGTTAAGGYLYVQEDNTTAAAKLVFQNFNGTTGALTPKGTLTTDLGDITAQSFRSIGSDASYVFAISGTPLAAGNAVMRFDATDAAYAVTHESTVTLAGALGVTRIQGATLPSTLGEVFAYADPNNGVVHVTQLDQAGTIVDDQIIAGATSIDRVRSFNDGRFEVEWRTTTPAGHSDVHFTIYDTRTAGISPAGTDAAETIVGTPFADTLNGLGGNDRIAPSYGTDVVNGGDGTDTVVLPYAVTAATVAIDPSGAVTLDSVGAHDSLSQVERFAFTDLSDTSQTWTYNAAGLQLFADHVVGALTHDTHSVGGEVYALYDGLLGRAPDPLGLEYWAAQFNAGVAPSVLAAGFLASPEGMMRSGAADNAGFVTQLFSATLHRAPDNDGLTYWTNQLNAGESRADVGVGFAFSTEHLANIQPALDQGLFVTDQAAAEAARVYYTVLGRAPEADGLKFWTNTIKGGTSIDTETASFLSAPEVQTATASLTTAQYVDRVYVNSLGRHAETDGLNYWVDAIDNHGAGRVAVTTTIGQSTEAQAHLEPLIELGWHIL